MTTNISISTGQRKILERFKAGVRQMLDPGTGRYAFFQGDVAILGIAPQSVFLDLLHLGIKSPGIHAQKLCSLGAAACGFLGCH